MPSFKQNGNHSRHHAIISSLSNVTSVILSKSMAMFKLDASQVNAFVSGAVSVSFIWYLSLFTIRRRRCRDIDNTSGHSRNNHYKPKQYPTYQNIANDEHHQHQHQHQQEGERGNDEEEKPMSEQLKKRLRTKSLEGALLIHKIIEEAKKMTHLPSQIMRERWQWESIPPRKPSLDYTSDNNETTSSGIGLDLVHSISSNNSYNSRSSSTEEQKEPLEIEKNSTCIGAIFGLDVGGTLSKLLYFEKMPQCDLRRQSNENENENENGMESKQCLDEMEDEEYYNDSCLSIFHDDSDDEHIHLDSGKNSYSSSSINGSSSSIKAKIKLTSNQRSKQEDRQEALDRFYGFVDKLDSYGSNYKDKSMSFYSKALGGEFHFIQFETRYISHAIDLMKMSKVHLDITKVGATGGGAHKYADTWDKQLGIIIDKQDELESLVTGMQFVLADVVGECYTFSPREPATESDQESSLPNVQSASESACSDTIHTLSSPIHNETNSKSAESNKSSSSTTADQDETRQARKIHGLDQYWWSQKTKRDFRMGSDSYPYLLVMIGTGVSVLRVDGPRQHERISGSTIGGGTYWGLCRLLTDAESFESVLSLAERGDPSKIDM